MNKGIDFVGITVTFLCHDGKGNVLLAKRGPNCRDEHGAWDGGGGGLEHGDMVLETLRKEIMEEYGADVIAYEFFGYRDVHRQHDDQQTHWIALDHLVEIDRRMAKNGEPHKLDEIGWFRLDALPEKLHSQLPNFLSLYADNLKSVEAATQVMVEGK